MKNPRDYRKWTNRELEADPGGYEAAKKAYQEDQKAKADGAVEEERFAQFEARYTAQGGTKADARAEYQAMKNEDAAQGARRADDEARHHHLTTTRAAI